MVYRTSANSILWRWFDEIDLQLYLFYIILPHNKYRLSLNSICLTLESLKASHTLAYLIGQFQPN